MSLRSTNRTIVSALLAVAIVALLGCSRLTQENFNRIDEGMSFDEVTTILGEPTDSKSIGIGPLSGTAATWDDGKTRIEIKFLNERVQLKSLDRSSGDG